jgi:hypothetical protein
MPSSTAVINPFFERSQMTKPSQNPNPVLDPIIPVISAHSLVTAVSVGLFDALSHGPADFQSLALRTGMEPQGARLLLDVLSQNGYVKKSDGTYSLSDVSRMTLLESSPMSFVNWVKFCRFQIEAVGHLTDVVSGSGPIDLFEKMANPEDRLVHHRAIAETAKPIAPWIADVVPIPDGATRMLDIGGSHGVYSAGLCAKHPPMHSDVLELPGSIESVSQVVEEYGTGRFCSLIGANVLEWQCTDPYDAVFLGNIIHHFSPAEVESVLDTSYRCLADEGTIALWDIDPSDNVDDPTSAAFSLFFFITSVAKCYGSDGIRKFLENAGFTDNEVLRPPDPSSHALHIARKKRSG